MLDSIEKAIVFYHGVDFDGVCSAAIINWCPALAGATENFKFIASNYPMALDETLVDKDTVVIIVDFSFPEDDMLRIRSLAKEVIWCDHHASAIRDSISYGYDDMIGARNPKYAGCELTWSFFNPTTPMPIAVRMLGRYDVWDKSDSSYTNFQYGLRDAIPSLNYKDILWEELLGTTTPLTFYEILARGEMLFKYQSEQNTHIAESMCFEFLFHDYRVIAVNRSHINSQFFDTVYDPEKHDLMLRMSFDGQGASCSMYTTKDLDLSVLAKKYGGGGHAQACGFTLSKEEYLTFLSSIDCRRYNEQN